MSLWVKRSTCDRERKGMREITISAAV